MKPTIKHFSYHKWLHISSCITLASYNEQKCSVINVQNCALSVDTWLLNAYVLRNLGIMQSQDCTVHSQNPEIVYIPISRLRTRYNHAISRPCDFCCIHNWIQIVIQVSIIYKGQERTYEALTAQLVTINVVHTLKPLVSETSGKFEKIPSPQSWHGRWEKSGQWSAPVQGFTNLASSQLSSVIVSSDALTPLVCYARKLCLCNLKIGMQFPHSEIA